LKKRRRNKLDNEEIIQQLWVCLERGYTYAEAKLHIQAYSAGKDTVKKVVIEEVK
tara:strand:- start:47 stop:211 length:165 start_codon:yes stop_codon:yes gene_type:complete